MKPIRQRQAKRYFKCPTCGYISIAFKRDSHKTSKGHLKNLWCPHCKDEHNFVQISEWELR